MTTTRATARGAPARGGYRRAVVAFALAFLAPALGCGAAVEEVVVPPPPAPPDLEIAHLTDLLTSARLNWLVLVRPAELARVAWLDPLLTRIFQHERLDDLRLTTGVDVRRAPELALATYEGAPDDAVAYFVRHDADPLAVERRFRERLTKLDQRATLGHQLTFVTGLVGTSSLGFVGAGRGVAGYQFGGDMARGPAKIAALYAQGRLAGVPTALAPDALRLASERFGVAPLEAFLPGPFEGDLAQGARGLFAASTCVALSLAPTPAETLALTVFVGGDFASTEGADRMLRLAFDDLGASDLGHLLGLHAPRSEPRVTSSSDGLALEVELDPKALVAGLTAATSDDVRAFMN